MFIFPFTHGPYYMNTMYIPTWIVRFEINLRVFHETEAYFKGI